jgi:multiple sugar transport system substrate-binding protein
LTWDHPRGLAPLVALSKQGGGPAGTTVEWSARSLQAFADQPLEDLAANFDLLVIDHPHIPLVAGDDLLAPLEGCGHDEELALLAEQSLGSCHSSYRHGGHQYGLAIDAAAQVSVHRPDLVGDPPRTWSEVLDLAGEGKVLWPCKPVDAMSSFLTLSAQMGEEVCSREGLFVTNETGLAVFDLLHRLADRVGPECLAYNPIDVAERLSTSDEHCYVPLAFGYVNYSRPGFRPQRLAYRDIPIGPKGTTGSCLGGAGIAVSAKRADKEAAIAYAFWLASAAVQRDGYYWGGGQPANALAWADPAINDDSLSFFAATRSTLEGASVRPRQPGWITLQGSVGDLVHAALSRTMSDEACLKALDSERGRLMGRTV